MDLILAQQIAVSGFLLPESVRETLEQGPGGKFVGESVLILIPDHTRSLPLPFLFQSLVGILQDSKKITFMVALGTHPAVSKENLNRLVGITAEERKTKYKHISLQNHAWENPSALITLGVMDKDEFHAIAGHPSHEACSLSRMILFSLANARRARRAHPPAVSLIA